MMSDLALNVKCAEIMGFEIYDDQAQWKLKYPAVAVRLGIWAGECLVYDPVNNLEQAAILIQRFCLAVQPVWNIESGELQTWCVDRSPAHGSDPSLTRAIAQCVADIPTKRPDIING